MPARTLPVIETMAGIGCSTRARPVLRSPQTTLNTPAGRCSPMISAIKSVLDRGGVGRFEDHGVSGRQGRRPLPHGHHHRVVPRRHRAAHPDGLAPDERGVAGQILTGREPFEVSGGTGEEADLVDHLGDLFGHGQRHRLAGVLRDSRPDQIFGPGLEGVGDAKQGQAAF